MAGWFAEYRKAGAGSAAPDSSSDASTAAGTVRAYRSSSPSSTAASTAYSRVTTIREVSTRPAPTPGDIPSAVFTGAVPRGVHPREEG
jgi:hypothetical protein